MDWCTTTATNSLSRIRVTQILHCTVQRHDTGAKYKPFQLILLHHQHVNYCTITVQQPAIIRCDNRATIAPSLCNRYLVDSYFHNSSFLFHWKGAKLFLELLWKLSTYRHPSPTPIHSQPQSYNTLWQSQSSFTAVIPHPPKMVVSIATSIAVFSSLAGGDIQVLVLHSFLLTFPMSFLAAFKGTKGFKSTR